MATVINHEVPISLEANIAQLEEMNRGLLSQLNHNNNLLDKYRYERDYAALEEQQMQIVNQSMQQASYVWLASVHNQSNIENFVLNKVSGTTIIGKLSKFEPYKDYSHGYLTSFKDVFFIHPIGGDYGRYSISTKRQYHFGIFDIKSTRLNIMNKETFKDEEAIRYISNFTTLTDLIK